MNWIGTKNLGMLLLAIWLIATGMMAFVHIGFANMGLILNALAIAAGVLILIGRYAHRVLQRRGIGHLCAGRTGSCLARTLFFGGPPAQAAPAASSAGSLFDRPLCQAPQSLVR